MTPRDSGDGRKVKNTAPGLAGCIRLHSYYNMEICRMKRTARYINMYREIDALQADRPAFLPRMAAYLPRRAVFGLLAYI